MKMDNINWSENLENKTTIELPVSIIQESGFWIIASNDETKKLLGKRINAISYKKTKEEAIITYFNCIKSLYEYQEKRAVKYERWVPFIKGNWKQIGGTWFKTFGITIYFRYGKNMKKGWYIPFTSWNIYIYN